MTKLARATTPLMMMSPSNTTNKEMPEATTTPSSTKNTRRKGSKKPKNYVDINSRNIIDAPSRCKDGFGFAMYRCRKIYDDSFN